MHLIFNVSYYNPQVTGTPRVGKDFMVTVSFRNPFNFILTNVQLRLESPGLISTKVKTYK